MKISLKDKIKNFINNVLFDNLVKKNNKIPEKTWSDEDLDQYEGKEITLEDAENIWNIRVRYDRKISQSRWEDEYDHVPKASFILGLLDAAYFGKDAEDKLIMSDDWLQARYEKVNNINGYKSYNVGVGREFVDCYVDAVFLVVRKLRLSLSKEVGNDYFDKLNFHEKHKGIDY